VADAGALTLRVDVIAVAPVGTEEGEREQLGVGVGPETLQVRVTVPVNPFCPVTVKGSVAWPPGMRRVWL